MTVPKLAFCGMMNLRSNISFILPNISAACGRFVMLPVNTTLRVLKLRAANTDIMATVSNIMLIMPSARSDFVATSLSFPKFDAVRSGASPG